MARKPKNKIDRHSLTEDDKKMWKSLRICGHMTQRQLETFVSRNQINRYIKDGLLKKDVEIKDGKRIIGIAASSKGIRFAKKYLHLQEFYSPKSVHHDIGMADIYMSKSDEVRETFKSESQLRNEFKHFLTDLEKENPQKHDEIAKMWLNGDISTPDMAYEEVMYVAEERVVETVCYEAVTTHYRKPEIQAKINFTTIMDYRLEIERK